MSLCVDNLALVFGILHLLNYKTHDGLSFAFLT